MITRHELLERMVEIRKDCIGLMKSATDLSIGNHSQKLLALEISESVSRILAAQKSIIDELKKMIEPEFFMQDKSGRGYTVNLSMDGILNTHTYKDEEESDWDGITLKEWISDEPAVGDVWENETIRITKTK